MVKFAQTSYKGALWHNSCNHLLKFEDVLIEEVLELFVSVVDTELFESVAILEVLKSEHVEQPNREIVLRPSVTSH